MKSDKLSAIILCAEIVMIILLHAYGTRKPTPVMQDITHAHTPNKVLPAPVLTTGPELPLAALKQMKFW